MQRRADGLGGVSGLVAVNNEKLRQIKIRRDVESVSSSGATCHWRRYVAHSVSGWCGDSVDSVDSRVSCSGLSVVLRVPSFVVNSHRFQRCRWWLCHGTFYSSEADGGSVRDGEICWVRSGVVTY